MYIVIKSINIYKNLKQIINNIEETYDLKTYLSIT